MHLFYISAAAMVAAFIIIGIRAAGRVASASDYAVAGRSAGTFSVACTQIGGVIAGAATIGTVQMAYGVGLSGWWFTIGCCVGCAVVGWPLAGPLRRSGLSTLTEFIEREYGRGVALLTMGAAMLGTLASLVVQYMAGLALISSVVDAPRPLIVAGICVVILTFIYTGGLRSYGAVGKAKTASLCAMLVICCAVAIYHGQGLGTLLHDLPRDPWFDLFHEGLPRSVGSCLSITVGIMSTQIYVQPAFAARDERAARNGCIAAGLACLPLGFMCVWVGLAMKNMGVEVESSQALPRFLSEFFHPAAAGAMWSVLAITVVGGAAGLCLGFATNMSLDVIPSVMKIGADDPRLLKLSRASVIAAAVVPACVALAIDGAYILRIGFIGVGLRGVGMAVPLMVAILRPGLLSPRAAFMSAAAAIATMLGVMAFAPSLDPQLAGCVAGVAVALAFSIKR